MEARSSLKAAKSIEFDEAVRSKHISDDSLHKELPMFELMTALVLLLFFSLPQLQPQPPNSPQPPESSQQASSPADDDIIIKGG